MDTNFISGKNAFKHIFYSLNYWTPLDVDVLILHAPGEEEVGRNLGEEMENLWKINLKEKNFSFTKLNIISMDAAHLSHSFILKPLVKEYKKKKMFIAFALTNKMLCYPDLLQRIYYLRSVNKNFLEGNYCKTFRVFLSERLNYKNFLFKNDI